ncbi:hypothetical protein DFH08DRAFT_972880 [Mycena albidolilacea]|uniref:Uncharacterized protein n=1 Tax=Mycena albidolilacea TaxID=1033008 RepID=A0AAD6ZAZ2_9AGAR|nr:hypothetical protein DFH08DRAFT_972880 [Mycena albidolilacea]
MPFAVGFSGAWVIDICVSVTIIIPMFCSRIMRWIACHLWLPWDRELGCYGLFVGYHLLAFSLVVEEGRRMVFILQTSSWWALSPGALGFPLVPLVSLGRDGGSKPPGGEPRPSVASPLPLLRPAGTDEGDAPAPLNPPAFQEGL